MEKLINSLLSSADAEAFRDPVDWRGLGLHDYPHIIKRPMDLGTVKLRLERGSYATAEACAADVRLIWENCRTYNTGGVPRNLHKAADALSKRFEARFAKMPAGGRLKVAAKGNGSGGGKRTKGGGNAKSGAVDAPPTPTNEGRRRLARHLGRARMEDVTAAVHEIDRRCPTALVLKRARQGEGGKGDDDSGGGGGGGGGGGSSGVDGGDDLAMLDGTAAIEIEVDVDELDPWTFSAVERAVGLSSASTMRWTKKKRPALAAAAAGAAAASSGGGKSSSRGGGFRHRHQHQERGGAGTTAAAAEGAVGVKGDRGDGGAAAGAAVGAGAGAGAPAAEVRPCKKSKVAAGASL